MFDAEVRLPVFLQSVDTDLSSRSNVGVKYLCQEESYNVKNLKFVKRGKILKTHPWEDLQDNLC